LEDMDFLITEAFHMVLEIMKTGKDNRLIFYEIDPYKLVIIINKAYIVLKIAKRRASWSPHIGENQL
jgi:hypothetical protein